MVKSGLYSFPKTLVITELANDEAEVSTTGGSGASSDSVLLAKVRKHGKEYKLNPNNYDFLANGKEPIIIDEDGGYRHIQYAYKTYKIDVDGEDKKVVWEPSVHDKDNAYFITDEDESNTEDDSKNEDDSKDEDNK